MNLVLVTGAGASCDLGRDGSRLPLMLDWASRLGDDLESLEPGLAGALGLTSAMTGPEFEETLGALLRWHDVRPLGARFRTLGGERPGEGYPKEVVDAFDVETARLERILDAINRSLYTLFSSAQVDPIRATDAYGALLELFADSGLHPDRDPILDLVVATTNYDPSAEIALDGLGAQPETGFRRRPGRPPILDPTYLVGRGREDGRVPVLHLHGAVGWYERDGVVLEHHQDQPFNSSLGRPVVLYPDPDKDPTGDPVVHQMWREFEEALAHASHILVVGHSLHDPALVSKLREVPKKADVAITYLGRQDEQLTSAREKEVARLLALFPERTNVLPLTFGPRQESEMGALRAWVEARRASDRAGQVD